MDWSPIREGHDKVISVLVAAGADYNKLFIEVYTPLGMANLYCRAKVIDVLLADDTARTLDEDALLIRRQNISADDINSVNTGSNKLTEDIRQSH